MKKKISGLVTATLGHTACCGSKILGGMSSLPYIGTGLASNLDEVHHKLEDTIADTYLKTVNKNEMTTEEYKTLAETVEQNTHAGLEITGNTMLAAGLYIAGRNQINNTKQYLEDKVNEYNNFPYLKK